MMQTKAEILQGFTSKWEEIRLLIDKVDQDKFTSTSAPEIWSIAQEFDHVIKSAAAMSSALKNKPFLLKWKFGKPNRAIRSYDEALGRYNEKLASVQGKAVAPSPYSPKSEKSFNKAAMLDHWDSTLHKFDVRINKWSDKNLDKVLLPHPLLGKMMVRELLYFTHFHTEHHRKSLEKKVTQFS